MTATVQVYVAEGWWHPNVNAGRVHDHPESPGRGWSTASHRLCEQVYTSRLVVTDFVRLPQEGTS